MLTSVSSMTSVSSIVSSASSVVSSTSMLVVGVTTGSLILSGVLILAFIAKEVSMSIPDVDDRLVDSANAAIFPLVFAFSMIVVLQALHVIG